MISSVLGHLVACFNIVVIGSAKVLDSTEASCDNSGRDACLHSASLLQRLGPRVVVRPLPAELPRPSATSPVLDEHVHRADQRHSDPIAMSQSSTKSVRASEQVRVAADAVAKAFDATSMAAEAASSALRKPGAGLRELRRVQLAMKKAAEAQTLASTIGKGAEKAEESLQTNRQIGVFLQEASSTEAESKMKEAELLEKEAERLQTEESQANLVAAEAQNEASVAERAVTRAIEEAVVCNWKMSSRCAPIFEYMGVRYDNCVSDVDDSEAWCSHHDLYEGAWSSCSFACEPRSKLLSMAQQASKASRVSNGKKDANALGSVSLQDTQRQDPTNGASANLDETGYVAVAELCDSAEMTRFVRRLISAIGCRITNQNALVGFVPWYSGEADVQSFDKLDGEIRCLCTRGQGPPWLEPIDPANPPTGGLLKCTGRRCDESK